MDRPVHCFISDRILMESLSIYWFFWNLVSIDRMISYIQNVSCGVLFDKDQTLLRTTWSYLVLTDVKTVDACLSLVHYCHGDPDSHLLLILMFLIESA